MRHILSLVGMVVLFTVVVSPQVMADDTYTITQAINLIDCTATKTNNGIEQTINTDCEGYIAPTVNQLTTTNSRLVLSGTFDPATMRRLWVMFNGRTFVLGRDSELTVSGNHWRLDLSSYGMTLPPGEYTVVVYVETLDGKLIRSTSSLQVKIAPTPSAVTPPGQVVAKDDPLATTGQSPLSLIFIGGVLLAAGFSGFLAVKKAGQQGK